MEIAGKKPLPVDHATVWKALHDPAVLKASLPGRDVAATPGNNEFPITLVTGQARFRVKVTGRDGATLVEYRVIADGVDDAHARSLAQEFFTAFEKIIWDASRGMAVGKSVVPTRSPVQQVLIAVILTALVASVAYTFR